MPDAIAAGLVAVAVIGGGTWYFMGDKSGKVDKKSPPPSAAPSAPSVTPAPQLAPPPASAPTMSPAALPRDDTAQELGEALRANEVSRQQELRRKKAEDAKRKQQEEARRRHEEEAQRKVEETKRMQESEEKSRREAEEARRRTQQQAQPVPAPAQAQGPRTPQEACADRPNFISRGICETRACERPEFRNQAYCVQMRERQKQPSGGSL